MRRVCVLQVISPEGVDRVDRLVLVFVCGEVRIDINNLYVFVSRVLKRDVFNFVKNAYEICDK